MRKPIAVLALALVAAGLAGAQTEINLTQQGALAHGTGFPARCAVGQLYYYTGATPGILYACSAPNVWSATGSGGSGPGGVNADWTAADGPAAILNKPTFATVAFTNSYNDLFNKPTIPSPQVQTDWNASNGMGVLLNKPTLSTVAGTGSYTDLLNKPTLSTVAGTGSYTDLLNLPSIPTVAGSSILKGSSGSAVAAAYGDVVALWGGGTCSGYLKNDGTCSISGGMIYPGAGVPVSNGSSWLSSYAVGTAANNLVQLDSSGYLPALNASLLTNFPALNQSTSGSAGSLASGGGSLSISGAYAATLTFTGATSVTLPTSGLLVNTAIATLASLSSANGTAIPASATLLVNGGALGTPTSGNAANLTGYPYASLSGAPTVPTVGTGILKGSSGNAVSAIYSDVVSLWGGVACSGYLKNDGTCSISGGMIYPAAGVPNSNGSTWLSSYAVGTAANNLVQLNSSGYLPALNASLLTNFPTLNQSTSGSAGSLVSGSSALNVTGGYTATLTLTGPTSVTLPLSGTLVNTAVATLASLSSANGTAIPASATLLVNGGALGTPASGNAFYLTNYQWANLSNIPASFTATAHNLLSAIHGDTTASSAVRGGAVFALGSTPTWTQVAHSSTTGGYWKWNGTDVVASTGAASGTGACTTNQVATTLNADAAPTCNALSSAYLPLSAMGTMTGGTWQATKIDIAYGGTNATNAPAALVNLFPAGTRVGDLIYCSAYSSGCTAWTLLPGNNSGTGYLSENASGAPAWGSMAALWNSPALTGAVTAAAATDTAPVGSNLAPTIPADCTGTWTCATGWAITSGVATHTTGNTGALTASVTIATTGLYEVHFVTNSNPSGSLTISLGGSNSVLWMWTQSDFELRIVDVVVSVTGAQTLSFVPSSTYNGTVSSVTVHSVGAISTYTLALLNSDASPGVQFLPGGIGLFNTYAGAGVGTRNTSGNLNTAYGANAMTVNTAGAGNTAVGAYALNANTTGTSNTAVGYNVLVANSSGSENTAVGIRALFTNNASHNTAIGEEALQNNVTGGSNTAVGESALLGASPYSASLNVAVGNDALLSISSGSDNVAVGTSAATQVSSGLTNTAVGGSSLNSVASASGNTAIGNMALNSDTGPSNTGLGAVACRFATSGTLNTCLGYGAGAYEITGTHLYPQISGSQDTILGANATQIDNGVYNYMTVIGAAALGNCSNCIVMGRPQDTTVVSALNTQGPINGAPLTPPGMVTAQAPTSGGTCTIGTHYLKASFLNAAGETIPGTVSAAQTCASGQTIPVANIPLGPPGTTGRNVWMTHAGDAASGTYYLACASSPCIGDNSTTTFSVSQADGSTAAPGSNTTASLTLQVAGTTVIEDLPTAPSGACSPSGAWAFSQDGHATFCAAGTWTTKI